MPLTKAAVLTWHKLEKFILLKKGKNLMRPLYSLIISSLLTIAFMAALWHLSINSIHTGLSQTKSGGIIHISPEEGYRYSEYGLITILFAYNLLVIHLVTSGKKKK